MARHGQGRDGHHLGEGSHITALSYLTLLLLVLTLGVPLPARAAHHHWVITEVFSNADGTVQFVELFSANAGETGLSGLSVDTFGTTPTSAPLAPNVPSSLNKYLLLGTAGYAALAAQQGAPAPDRTLPNNFLEVLTADTVRYAGIAATDVSYPAGGLPIDGIDSIDLENPGGTVNTPQNFNGAVGSINAATPVPSLPRTGLLLLIGLVVVATTILLRRRSESEA